MTTLNESSSRPPFEPAVSPQRLTIAALKLAEEGVREALRLIEEHGQAGEDGARDHVAKAERGVTIAQMLMARPGVGG